MSNTGRVVILTILVYYVNAIEAEQINNIPELLVNVLKKYENYKESSNTDSEKASSLKVLRKSYPRSDVEDTIRAKIAELAPLLDDMKHGREEKHDSENGDNIAESFSENNNFNPANLQFKRMRKEIEKLMELEPITNETKGVVIEALGQIETELNVNDCYLDKVEGDEMRRRHSGDGVPSIVIPKNMERAGIVMKHIKDKWDKIVYQYSMPDLDKTHNDTVRKVAFVFLTRLRQFVLDMHEDYTKLQTRYEMKCFNDVTKAGPKYPVFRPGDNNETLLTNDNEDCNDIIMICREELLDFLTDFYNQLNDTCSEVFKNYMVMYFKEVEAAIDEKQTFIDVLELIEGHVHKKVKKIFIIEVGKLHEVLNVSSPRVEALKHLIDRTIHNAKEEVYKSLSLNLRKLKPKLRLTVKQDIDVATGIELGNLQKEFQDKMCSVFRQCNGDGSFRRFNKRHSNVDPNTIKIRFKFGLGDDPYKLLQPYLKRIKSSIKHKGINRFKSTDEIKDLNTLSARKTNVVPFDINKFKGINVTRTTYADYVEKGTTKAINNSLKNDTNVNVTLMESSISYSY